MATLSFAQTLSVPPFTLTLSMCPHFPPMLPKRGRRKFLLKLSIGNIVKLREIDINAIPAPCIFDLENLPLLNSIIMITMTMIGMILVTMIGTIMIMDITLADMEDIAMVDMESRTMVGVIDEGISGMVVVVTEITFIEDAGVALLLKRQSHTNKLMRHKLTIDLSMLS
ncbi:hypothetical protein E3N88_04136 [Mikania micrantha]|uniref:Uncharacterized protein n=1 Tax=Mikania micrantha TaxID=192012 RepID=A0A5N6PVR5_9ASTR|nr:hypothetical protein E3N88_04136 [Mikania micrantha]